MRLREFSFYFYKDGLADLAYATLIYSFYYFYCTGNGFALGRNGASLVTTIWRFIYRFIK